MRFWIEVRSTLLTEAKSRMMALRVGLSSWTEVSLPRRGPGSFQGLSPSLAYDAGFVRRVCLKMVSTRSSR